MLFVSAAAAATSLVGAILLTRNIVFHLERVRDASHELASGDLAARAPEGGPAELAELATSFNAMAGHLEEVFDARRELVAWASHDLRAPITSLQAMLEAMEDGVVEPQHYLETLQGQVRLLSTLVDDLFEMACIDSGAITLAVGPVDLGALVKGFLQHYELEAQARGLRVRTIVRDERDLGGLRPGQSRAGADEPRVQCTPPHAGWRTGHRFRHQRRRCRFRLARGLRSRRGRGGEGTHLRAILER